MSDKAEQYRAIKQQAESLLSASSNPIANAANLSALLYHQLPQLNWVGFYFFQPAERRLTVGPFQGQPACVHIPMGKGVCGTAAASGELQRVDDVDRFAGHIACDAASRSEIVIPLFQDQQLLGVLDLDSPLPARFDAADEQGLSELAAVYLDSIA